MPDFLLELKWAVEQNQVGPEVLQRYRRRAIWWRRLGLHLEDLSDWPQHEVDLFTTIMAMEVNYELAEAKRRQAGIKRG